MTEKVWGGKCDLCNAGLEIGGVIYTHFTPSTGTKEQAERKEAFWCEDPEWGACPDCHERVVLYDRGLMTMTEFVAEQSRQSLMNQQMLMLGDLSLQDQEFMGKMQQEQMDFVVKVVSLFADFHIPEFREEVNGGVLPGGGRP